MQLLPVLDLMNGQVVHARAGDRARYRPMRTPLCDGAEPVALAQALMGLAPFAVLYVADLDAIMHQGQRHHGAALARLCQELGPRGASLWVDAGWHDSGCASWRAQLRRAAQRAACSLVWVVGSESLVADQAVPADAVLSLDYRQGMFLGPAGLDDRPELWPARVIAMELAAVGSDAGPALALLQRLRERCAAAARGEVQIFAAGGVRDEGDLRQLQALGVSGALIASALHSGRLDAAGLQRLLQA